MASPKDVTLQQKAVRYFDRLAICCQRDALTILMREVKMWHTGKTFGIKRQAYWPLATKGVFLLRRKVFNLFAEVF